MTGVQTCALPIFGYSDSILTLSFTDSSTDATNWLWIFGDGEFDITQNPVYIYDTSGIYNVCLFAISICGTDTFCQTIYVDISCALVITIDSIKDVSCYDGNDGTAYITAHGGTSSYSYLWSPGEIGRASCRGRV